ncbi:hypothetical protein EAI_12408 [Harpegnathos saltator]|uniref:Phorbol-ester/DAG-type domain-containing protein n=1 Tax=Harpegnathos saltator TaxID=610380 RepID=E2C9V8_HARSA|nr:hypothetical protein EAI_12408 [Harpegnathos saltator]
MAEKTIIPITRLCIVLFQSDFEPQCHVFRTKQLRKPRPCHLCHQAVIKQASCCRVCKYICHKTCEDKGHFPG